MAVSRISNELQSVRDKLKEIERTAENAIEKLDQFTFSEFDKDFIQNNNLFRKRKLKPGIISEITDRFPLLKKFRILREENITAGTISTAYLSYIKKLLTEGRIRTAVNYHDSYISLKKFWGHVRYRDITPSYLSEYENWLKNQDISKTTIGMYLRPLPDLFNEAIDEGIINREKCYPFGRRKYQIPTSKNIKKSLNLDDIKKIYY